MGPSLPLPLPHCSFMTAFATRIFRSLRLLPALCALLFISRAGAATSYLMIRGPFGLAGATETYQYRFDYNAGLLASGQSLLNTLFGTPVDTGTFYEFTPYYVANNSILGTGNSAAYVNYGTPSALSLFVASFTLHNTEVDPPPFDFGASFNPAWIYYTSPGSSTAWAESFVGAGDRALGDGSYDAWVYGGYDSIGNSISDVSAIPTSSASFANLTNLLYSNGGVSVYGVAAVPEPGRVLLLGAGCILLVFRRGRRMVAAA